MCNCANVARLEAATETYLSLKECADIAAKYSTNRVPVVKAIREALSVARNRIDNQ